MKLKTRKDEAGFEITIGDTILTVSPLTSSEMTRLREDNSKIKRGVEKTNGSKMTREMFERVVLAWRPKLDQDGKPVPGGGVNDEAGNPMECTIANKRIIYEYNSGFVADVLKEIEEAEEDQRLGLEGNSRPGLNGTSAKGK